MTDYTHDLNIGNADGATVRADINSLAAALASDSHSSTAPSTTLPSQRWNDITGNLRKRRNLANSGWIVEGTLDETFVLSRSSNTMLGSSDIGKTIRATGTFTQTLDAAATLGDGWQITYVNEGTGVITFDPNSTETIDGGSTAIIAPGESCEIKCNGTNFRTTLRAAVGTPQGRLTLTSGTPVMSADATAQSSVYYTPYTGDRISIYDGVRFVPFGFAELTMTLNSSNQTSGNIYDLFVFNNAGTVTIAAGPAWTGATSRGTGAGTTELQAVNGLWVNKNSIAVKNASSSYTAAAKQATYVGSIYCTANGQTGIALYPIATSGGTNNVLGVYNAYNRVRTAAVCRDGTASWTYATSTVRNANNSASNRISFLDGLQQSHITSSYQCALTGGAAAAIGAALNDGGTGLDGISGTVSGTNQVSPLSVNNYPPQIGFHYIQAKEVAFSGTFTFATAGAGSASIQGLTLIIEM
ncbi:MAG: hypothetical protein JWN34_359 [Bryobacterales bacterium]|nr:hypothetical protein [Bryobacterales bacterium]